MVVIQGPSTVHLLGCAMLFVITQSFSPTYTKTFQTSLPRHLSLLTSTTTTTSSKTTTLLRQSSPSYGESGTSPIIKEFSMYDDLKDIIKLASQPLPERPDGIVAVVKYTSASRGDCRKTEAGYDRLARAHPDTIFLRCFEEYDNADVLFGMAEVGSVPTFDIFYGGDRVARVEGPEYTRVEELINNYGFINSKLDLFSEDASSQRQTQWGDGKKKDPTKTPRTTARFIPGYDWGSDKGFFDDAADKAMDNFESQFENWTPKVDD